MSLTRYKHYIEYSMYVVGVLASFILGVLLGGLVVREHNEEQLKAYGLDEETLDEIFNRDQAGDDDGA